MYSIGLLIVLSIFIMIIAWIGNAITDRVSDHFRNDSIRRENATKPVTQERLGDRYK